MKKDRFYKDTDGRWRWRLTDSGNHQIVAGPQQGYGTKRDAKEGWENTRVEVLKSIIEEIQPTKKGNTNGSKAKDNGKQGPGVGRAPRLQH